MPHIGAGNEGDSGQPHSRSGPFSTGSGYDKGFPVKGSSEIRSAVFNRVSQGDTFPTCVFHVLSVAGTNRLLETVYIFGFRNPQKNYLFFLLP